MVDVGPLADVYCPNGNTCPHDIAQHRYEPDRQRWVCTVEVCHENPYRVVKVSDHSFRMLNAAGYRNVMETLRAEHGPEATIEITDGPSASSADDPWDDKPYAEIKPVGRWTYRVSVMHGLLSYGPNDGYGWLVFGRARAERKAAKVLVRYLRDEARRADVTRVETSKEDAKDAAEIVEIQARTIDTLVHQGFTRESAEVAVRAEDIALLVYSPAGKP